MLTAMAERKEDLGTTQGGAQGKQPAGSSNTSNTGSSANQGNAGNDQRNPTTGNTPGLGRDQGRAEKGPRTSDTRSGMTGGQLGTDREEGEGEEDDVNDPARTTADRTKNDPNSATRGTQGNDQGGTPRANH